MTSKSQPIRVLIPNRGMIAMDIIGAFQYRGIETYLMASPEDQTSLPVRLADKCFRFFSSLPENSYMDSESIIEKALELEVDFLHPGYGFLAEDPKFYSECRENNINIIGPDSEILSIIHHKRDLRNMAAKLGIATMEFLKQDPASTQFEDRFNIILKRLKGSGEERIRVIDSKEAFMTHMGQLNMTAKEEEEEYLLERYLPQAHRIELPFLRDQKGHTLFLPEIESSIQRRFEEIFHESPSPNITENMRSQLAENSKKILDELNFVGIGHMEFMLNENRILFSDIDPTIQPHTRVSEITGNMNLIQKQYDLFTGELLSQSQGVHVIKSRSHVMLASLMAEDPHNGFRPSSGTVTEFFFRPSHQCTINSILFPGNVISPIYDPLIGSIMVYNKTREEVIRQMNYFLKHITIKGVRTNLAYLKYLLKCEHFIRGETTIETFDRTCDFGQQQKSEEENIVAAAVLAAAFHRENKKKNFKVELEKMKQPSIFKRLFSRWQ